MSVWSRVMSASHDSSHLSEPILALFIFTVLIRVGGELTTCPYPLNVEACPPRDQRPALQASISGQCVN